MRTDPGLLGRSGAGIRALRVPPLGSRTRTRTRIGRRGRRCQVAAECCQRGVGHGRCARAHRPAVGPLSSGCDGRHCGEDHAGNPWQRRALERVPWYSHGRTVPFLVAMHSRGAQRHGAGVVESRPTGRALGRSRGAQRHGARAYGPRGARPRLASCCAPDCAVDLRFCSKGRRLGRPAARACGARHKTSFFAG